MKKFLLISLYAAIAGSMTAATVPVRAMLDKYGYSEYQEANRPAKASQESYTGDNGILYTPVMNEDFSLMTEGTNDNPSSVLIEDSDEFTSIPGWTLYGCFQAGGAVYEGWLGDNDPGYIKSPNLNLDGEAFRIRVHAKNMNENNPDALLQMFTFDEGGSSIISAYSLPMGDDWSELIYEIGSGREETSVMLFSWSGKVLIDDVTVETMTYPLATPSITSAKVIEANEVEFFFTPVEGAENYTLYVYDSFSKQYNSEENPIDKVTVGGDATSAVLHFVPDASSNQCVYIYATAPGKISAQFYYNPTSLMPDYIGEPEALPATDIDDYGFTANWMHQANALTYLLRTNISMTATEDSEFTLLSEDFSNVDSKYDSFNPGMVMMGGLDTFLSNWGWTSDFCLFMNEGGMSTMILTNLYALYGFQGYVMSPFYDFSNYEGDINVSSLCLSAAGDCEVTVALVNEQGEEFVSEAFEVGTQGAMPEIALDPNGEKAAVKMYMSDSDEAEDMIMFLSLYVGLSLKEGESFSGPYRSFKAPYDATSLRIDVPFTSNYEYDYSVQGIYNPEFMSSESEMIHVARPTGITGVFAEGNVIATEYYDVNGVQIQNPDKGIFIKVDTLTDGTVRRSKIMR